jgi:hypothetical protein
MAGRTFSTSYLLGREYFMSPEEKVASGDYEGLSPDETRPMINHLLGTAWKGKRS